MQGHEPIRVAHVLFHFGIGGLENGVVNLINGLPENDYQHAVICLTDYDPDYVQRVRNANCELRSLHKRPGQDPRLWSGMWRALREFRPHVLHTRNFAALEMQLVGAALGVRGRVHGEHGWDVQDLDGSVRKYRLARRFIGHAVHRFIALSRDLERYLVGPVGIPAAKVSQVYNGVDCDRFRPPANPRDGDPLVIGTVGRMKTVKNQTLLCRAFADLAARRPDLAAGARLRLVGSGPLAAECRNIAAAAGIADRLDLVGDSDTVEEELRAMDVFVLPSLAEGISNTILEAMASGLPVIATRVGGNPELIADGDSGVLVAVEDEAAMSTALERYLDDGDLRRRHGQRGRELALERFSLNGMIDAYDRVYRGLARAGSRPSSTE